MSLVFFVLGLIALAVGLLRSNAAPR